VDIVKNIEGNFKLIDLRLENLPEEIIEKMRAKSSPKKESNGSWDGEMPAF
jgi:hypothetical protein